MELKDIVERTPAFWGTLANKCVGLLKRYANAGTAFDGTKFPDYSPEYAKRKSGGRKTDGGSGAAKKVGAGTRQSSRQINPPNLQFSGDMMRDCKRIAFDGSSATIGWPTFGDRLEWNATMGRSLVDLEGDTPHPQIQDEVFRALELDTEEKIKKWEKEKIVINIKK